ncbi:uncharacterized protein HMPREF1541_02366 [Cyphellophora europaea CBS 101466]|uniref:Amidohydrolase 3 domain-containing protein n=1 Tax=Cyphellophora europaea (strain CBS 101466) TaxID=1220924 RepID=W2S3E1_CYPE1|nr:uncharacterized protein HMPREF1541_02366 [Cyphellophora europaea CBS 101466]ETN43207.1 hypothetical protein HMPREF1541_02366 [Cyphellophora europaea CBS 101466]
MSSQTSAPPTITLHNALLILPSSPVPTPGSLTLSATTGLITSIDLNSLELAIDSSTTAINLHSLILAPGYLDLQVNGLAGVHFTRLCPSGTTDPEDDAKLLQCARMQASAGVTGWWATIPTVPQPRWKQILPALAPRSFVAAGGAEMLGAHCEGPFLCPAKKGAHCADFMLEPAAVPVGEVYGERNLEMVLKMITVAPELPGAPDLIRQVKAKWPWVRVAIGHTAASYEEAVEGIRAGASMVTHTFNAMNGVTGREPGVPGLMEGAEKGVWYSAIADGVHLHRAVLDMAVQLGLHDDGNGSGRCIGITDAIELAGLEDGVYGGNGQIVGRQIKEGNKVTIEGTGTLVGSCVLVDHVVRELAGINAAGAQGGVSEAWKHLGEEERGKRLVKGVKAVSENVAAMMGEKERGLLAAGKRADLVVLDWEGSVRETWVAGTRVFQRIPG